jgi:hypothetical protein
VSEVIVFLLHDPAILFASYVGQQALPTEGAAVPGSGA